MAFKKILAAGIACGMLGAIVMPSMIGFTVMGQTPKATITSKNNVSKNNVTSIEAEDYDNLSGGKVLYAEEASKGAHLGDFTTNSKAFYTINVQDAGTYEVSLRIATPQGGTATVSTESLEADPCRFKPTGGWQTYTNIKVSIWLNVGEQTLSVDNLNSTWNFDKLEIKYLSNTQKLTNISKKAHVSTSSGDGMGLNDNTAQNVWQADGTKGEIATMRFNREYNVNSVKLSDIAKSHITAGTLLFSDGTSIPVQALSTEGTTIEFESKTITWLKFTIDEVSSDTKKAGLAEFEVMGISKADSKIGYDLGLDSFIKNTDDWVKMTDSLKSLTIAGDSLKITWAGKFLINKIVFVGLPSNIDKTISGKIIFNENNDEKKEEISFSSKISKINCAEYNFDVREVESIVIRIDGLTATDETKIDMLQIFGTGAKDLSDNNKFARVYVENRWKGQKLAERDGKGIYASSTDDEYLTPASMWKILQIGDNFTLQNLETLHFLTLTDDNDTVECTALGNTTKGGLWKFTETAGYMRISNVQYPSRAIHLENQEQRPGEVLASENVLEDWYSAMWKFPVASVPQEHYYKITANKIEGTAGDAVAYVGNSITSSAGGSYKTWNQTVDTSKYPQFSAENSTITEAIYNLSMEEALLNIHDGKYGKVFWTGTNWGGVWTRDVAMSIQYSLAWQFANESKNSILEKVIGDKANPGKDVIQQDTGTGGSYPCSVDRIIMALATWEHYLSSGDTAFLDKMYTLIENTIEQDYHVAYDKNYGLFNGETGGLDHRSKTYPDWMDESFKNSIVNIAQSKSSIVNIVFTEAMNVLSKSAKILGKGDDMADFWHHRSEELKTAVNKYFWIEERGMYASFIYPDYMGSPVADKADVISNGYALMYDIASPEQKTKIMENYPLVTYGAPTVWPQKNGMQAGTVYHNRGVWPGWEATMMIGAKENGNLQLADELWKSCLRNAGVSLTNKEVVDFTTGEGTYSDRQLWSVAGTMAGYYRVLFGMEYKEDGIHFSPYVPDWIDGPFELNNYAYRNSIIDFKLSGKGDTLASIKVDGNEKPLDYIFSIDLQGKHTIEMEVTDSGKRSKINLAQNGWDVCPEMPVLTQKEDGTLTWEPKSKYTYKLWNGKEYLDVTGKDSYKPENKGYGIYSLVAVDAKGISSELSKPILINDNANIIKIEAEDQTYKDAYFASKLKGFTGTGYVIDGNGRSSDMVITVTVPKGKAGEYLLSSIYNNHGDATGTNFCGIRSVFVDDRDAGTMIFPLSNHIFDKSSYVNIYLSEGEHKIKVIYDKTNFYDRNINVLHNDISFDSFELEFIGVDRVATVSNLQKNYDFALGFKNDGTIDGLTASARDSFMAVLDEALAALNGDLLQTNQAYIDEVAQKLIKVMDYLDFKQADKTDLNKAIEMADSIAQNLDKYKSFGKDEFVKSLGNAKKISQDQNIVQGDKSVEEACKNLVSAMAALELKADKTDLKTTLDKANALDKSLYTQESYENLSIAIKRAQMVFDNDDATQAEVKDSAAILEKAINELKAIPPIIDNNGSNDNSDGKDDDSNVQEIPGIPNTGDESGVVMAASVAIGCLATSAVIIKAKKKKSTTKA